MVNVKVTLKNLVLRLLLLFMIVMFFEVLVRPSILLYLGALSQFLFLIPFRMAKIRQTLYITGYLVTNTTTLNIVDMDFIADLDGIFKEFVTVTTTNTAPASAGRYVMSWSFYRSDMTVAFPGEGVGHGTHFDWTTWHDWSSINEAIFSTTQSKELLPNFYPLSEDAGGTTMNKRRMSLVTKKNEEWHITYVHDEVQDESFTMICETYFEILFVVSPWSLLGIIPSTQAMKHVTIVNLIGNGTAEVESAQMPCSGYLTNMSLIASRITSPEAPIYFSVSPEMDNDLVDHFAITDLEFDQGYRAQNGITAVISSHEDMSNLNYEHEFMHFGSRYLKVHRRSYLNFMIRSQQVLDGTFFFEADFIPFKGALFKQRWNDSEVSASKDYDTHYFCPIKLEDVTVTMIAVVTAGSALLNIRHVPAISEPRSQGSASSISDEGGDQVDSDSFSEDGVYSAQNELATIPFSINAGAQVFKIKVGKMYQGDRIGFDWDQITSMAGTIIFFVEGRVGKQYYDKSSNFVSGHSIMDLSEYII